MEIREFEDDETTLRSTTVQVCFRKLSWNRKQKQIKKTCRAGPNTKSSCRFLCSAGLGALAVIMMSLSRPPRSLHKHFVA